MTSKTLTGLPSGTPVAASLVYVVVAGKSRKAAISDLPVVAKATSSTDNAMVRWDGVTGALIQDTSFWTTDDNGVSTLLGTSTQAPGLFVGIAGDTMARVALGVNSTDTPRISMGPGGSTARDTFLMRKTAATWQLGTTDAAAPVAQSVAVQSVVTGTSNTAGANLTVMGSQGTGTGAGGSILFQTAAASTTGSTQNALATVLTINSDGQTGFALGTTALPSAIFSGDASTGWFRSAANQWTWQGSGTSYLTLAATAVRLHSSETLLWTSGTSTGTADLSLTRRAAANLRLGPADVASPIAQTLSVQSVVTGTSNTAGANWTITGSQGTGTGAGGSIIFQTAPAGSTGSTPNALATVLTLSTTSAVVASGKNLLLGNAAVTGLTAGVLAALTNATIVIYDSSGQAYRIPCIV